VGSEWEHKVGRVNFLLQSTRKIITGQNANCPYCGSASTRLVQRKKLIIQLRKCQACSLQFRYPKDDIAENKAYYQTAYHEARATDLPNVSDLPRYKETNFKDIARDISGYITTIRQYKPTGAVLDYGCSWGYGVFQFCSEGYKAVGYEISAPRADFGREHLGVTIHGSIQSVADHSFDVIFSSHVLEHIPDSSIPFRDFRRLLKPDGLLFILVPNGSCKLARELGTAWPQLINEKHVLALTAEFFSRNLSTYGFCLAFTSSPYDKKPIAVDAAPNLDGEELMVIGEPVVEKRIRSLESR
jgi:2-polyprenyl-3-methyl-5-hydroxy-6-metoxy-1,4-benzoquinol methylase